MSRWRGQEATPRVWEPAGPADLSPAGSSPLVLAGNRTVPSKSHGSGSAAASPGFAAGVTVLPLGPGRCWSRSQPQPPASYTASFLDAAARRSLCWTSASAGAAPSPTAAVTLGWKPPRRQEDPGRAGRVTGRASPQPSAPRQEMYPPRETLSHPSGHQRGGAWPSPVPSARPVALASATSRQLPLGHCAGGAGSAARLGTARAGESRCLP